MTALADAKAAQTIAEARLATMRADLQCQAIESSQVLESSPRYATGDPRPYSTQQQYGEPPQSYQEWAAIPDVSSIYNRENDRFQPYYLDDFDLSRKRGEWRNIGAFSTIAIGALESRKNYVLGDGMTFEATPEGDQNDQIAKAVQSVIDQFLEDNSFDGVLDSEIFDRTSEDGEAFIGLYPQGDGDWRTAVQVIEPDQIAEPLNITALDAWLDKPGLSYWWNGVHTQALRLSENAWVDNVSKPLGYHVVYDTTGEMWDYLTTDRCHHIKRNTPINARRGVSDYLPVLRDIELESKLKQNTGEGAAIQAAIAFIKEHPPGISASSVEALSAGLQTGSYNKQVEGGTTNTPTRKFNSGTILDVGQTKYHAGPLGSIQSPIFIEVAGYLLRSIAVRWNMPEYMISADASNANYSSTLVSESPFVKARERDQRFYKRHFKQLAWKAVRIAHEANYFRGVAWEALQKAVTINVEAPDVASRDRLANAQEKQMLNTGGILSKRTWAAEAGYNYDEEVERMAEEPAPEGQVEPEQNPAESGVTKQPIDPNTEDQAAVVDKGLNGAQMTSAVDVLAKLSASEMTPVMARELLLALGLDPTSVERMLSSAKDAVLTVDESTRRSVISAALESVDSSSEAVAILEGL